MQDAAVILDQALHLAERERELLAVGDVDATEALAKKRMQLVERALTNLPSTPDIGRRLTELKALQDELTATALALRAETGQELRRLREEDRRMGGYYKGNQTACKAPMVSRFLNARG